EENRNENPEKRFAAVSKGTGRLVHRYGTNRSAVSGGRAGPRGRQCRHVRARRPHRVAHASTRTDSDRHFRPRLDTARWRARRGDVVWFEPGEKHWHGASPTTAMQHIAIQEALNGKAVDWLEKVSDEQYRRRSRADQ